MEKYVMTMIKMLLFTLCIFPVVQAEVITDGSLGAKVELSGKDFQITPELGQQLGGNLFHSFQSFNLNSDESATFSGADSVQNIIARVTGGQASTIDGILRSTISNADLYFLNPYGIMFGQNAKLDLQGGFHVSTADYLKLQDGGRFEARNPTNSLLSVAPITAFGFLTESPATLELQNSQLLLPYGQDFSLIGGNLSFNAASVNVPSGQMTFSSLAQAGQIVLANPSLTNIKGGTIELQNHSKVSTSGIGGGNVLIRGGQLIMDNSTIEAHTLGDQDGKHVDIAANESVTIRGEVVAIGTPNFGDGQGSKILIDTPHLEITGSFIDTGTLGSGRGGDLEVQAQQVILRDGGSLASSTFGNGKGGNITINASEFLTITGRHRQDFNLHGVLFKQFISTISASSFGSSHAGDIRITTPKLILNDSAISTDSIGVGEAGNITIQAHTVTLSSGGFITSNVTSGTLGGIITVDLSDTLTIMGSSPEAIFYPSGLVIKNQSSGIISSTFGVGQAGRVLISAPRILLTDGGVISASTGDNGDAGEIQIIAEELQLTNRNIHELVGEQGMVGTGQGGIFSSSGGTVGEQVMIGTGRGGNIRLYINKLIIEDGVISAQSFGSGEAGELMIQTKTIQLSNQGRITTSALHASGGNIHLTATEQLYLHNTQITTSVKGGKGNGGNITIEQPQFTVLNQAQIKAQADAGHGGNIRIAAQHFVKSVDSLVSASSNLGIDGQILIQSPTEDVGNQVLSLSANFLNAAALLPLSCAARIADQRPSEFTRPFTLVLKPHILSDVPEDVRPSYISQLKQIRN